ncbi:hypothetical protein [Thalassoporum mexicanum]|uniref:hypothetical protein n=1 Tax=Thalassoporum mexicanum TaxID=3457544 RepID=UPI0002E159C5|nr:hypothetical protein [Pseudanabaena sp. PCC 7367]
MPNPENPDNQQLPAIETLIDPQVAQQLDDQIAELINDAPQDGGMPQAVSMLSSVLKAIAAKLEHLHYFIIQTQAGDWLLTTLSHRDLPEVSKRVIYAYGDRTVANVERLKLDDPKLICVEIGVIDLLFRLIGLQAVDSLIVFDSVAGTTNGTEIVRAELQQMCEKHLKRLQYGRSKLAEVQRQRAAADPLLARPNQPRPPKGFSSIA